MPIQPSSKVVLNEIHLIADSNIEVYPKIKFSQLKTEESSLNLNVNPSLFLIVVHPGTDGTNQFLQIEGFCSDGGGTISVSVQGKSYYLMQRCRKVPKQTFGFELIDIHGFHWFTPFAPVSYGNFKFGFSFNSNYITLNGITF